MPLHNFSVILKIPPDAQIRSRIEYLISTEDIHVLHVHSNLFFFSNKSSFINGFSIRLNNNSELTFLLDLSVYTGWPKNWQTFCTT